MEAWADFRDDDGVDVAILTGAGDAFCAGADLKTYIPPIIKAASRASREIVDLGFGGLTRGLHRIHKPIVAAINGWALAGGLEQALACDIRIASDRAMFGSFEARRGYHHGDGGIVRLVNTCGVGVALAHAADRRADRRRSRRCSATWSRKVVPHDELHGRGRAGRAPDPAQLPARGALGQGDDPRRDRPGRSTTSCASRRWNAYTCADPEETLGLLQRFYDKPDAGRAGQHATALDSMLAYGESSAAKIIGSSGDSSSSSGALWAMTGYVTPTSATSSSSSGIASKASGGWGSGPRWPAIWCSLHLGYAFPLHGRGSPQLP